MYEMTGILKVKREAKQATETFKVREFVLTYPASQYPQHISFQLTQDRCALLDNVQEGEMIKVGFYVRGREWQSKEGDFRYFNSLDVFKIEGAKEVASSPAKNSSTFTENDALSFEQMPKKSFATVEEDDYLPF